MPSIPSAYIQEFRPKLLSLWREGYGLRSLQADAMAGLTVAIVALPLSMAIAIASGVGPERGLYTTIVGGFVVSALGGSRFQIGGPAGAFIVLVGACVGQIGVQGLIAATLLSGGLLMLLALLRAGSYVRYIPYPVTLGFTAGIALIIFASQIKDLLGLRLSSAEPSDILAKLEMLWAARATVSLAAVAVAAGTGLLILCIRRLAPAWPNLLIAVTLAAVAVAGLHLPVETIDSRFGALPHGLPAPALPALDWTLLQLALPWALSFTLLGAIESLLSAVVADGMSGRRHRPNAELLAQGAANIAAAIFGGFCVTGTIARTATNIRAGSQGPVSGMLHAGFVLVFMLIAAPLAGFIPLAALAAVLTVVAWNMIERDAIWHLARSARAEAAVLFVTLALVLLRDLTEGIVVGFALSGLVFIRRMTNTAHITASEQTMPTDRVLYHLHGPYFFGAAAELGDRLDRIADRPGTFVLDFEAVPFIDSSGARSFALMAEKMARRGGVMVLAATRPEVEQTLRRAGVTEPHARFVADLGGVDEALPETA